MAEFLLAAICGPQVAALKFPIKHDLHKETYYDTYQQFYSVVFAHMKNQSLLKSSCAIAHCHGFGLPLSNYAVVQSVNKVQ